MPKANKSNKSKRTAEAKKSYARIAERIKPFIRPRKEKNSANRGVWRRGADLPAESEEHFRIESS